MRAFVFARRFLLPLLFFLLSVNFIKYVNFGFIDNSLLVGFLAILDLLLSIALISRCCRFIWFIRISRLSRCHFLLFFALFYQFCDIYRGSVAIFSNIDIGNTCKHLEIVLLEVAFVTRYCSHEEHVPEDFNDDLNVCIVVRYRRLARLHHLRYPVLVG